MRQNQNRIEDGVLLETGQKEKVQVIFLTKLMIEQIATEMQKEQLANIIVLWIKRDRDQVVRVKEEGIIRDMIKMELHLPIIQDIEKLTEQILQEQKEERSPREIQESQGAIISRKEGVLQEVIILTEVVVEGAITGVLHQAGQPAEVLDRVQLLKVVTGLRVALAADHIKIVRVIVLQVDSGLRGRVVADRAIADQAVRVEAVQGVAADQVHREEDKKMYFR